MQDNNYFFSHVNSTSQRMDMTGLYLTCFQFFSEQKNWSRRTGNRTKQKNVCHIWLNNNKTAFCNLAFSRCFGIGNCNPTTG